MMSMSTGIGSAPRQFFRPLGILAGLSLLSMGTLAGGYLYYQYGSDRPLAFDQFAERVGNILISIPGQTEDWCKEKKEPMKAWLENSWRRLLGMKTLPKSDSSRKNSEPSLETGTKADETSTILIFATNDGT